MFIDAAAGWFSEDPRDSSPCTFTSITPAWNNENLNRLACKIRSPVIFAHVRAAYPGMPVSEQNCHPFQWGRYLFAHNGEFDSSLARSYRAGRWRPSRHPVLHPAGVVGGFMSIRRALLNTLSDAAYNTVQSFHSDSAVCFSIFLHQLPDLTSQHSPDVLLKAMQVRVREGGQATLVRATDSALEAQAHQVSPVIGRPCWPW